MANETSNVYVSLEFTPNPNTLKYSVNRDLLPRGALNFVSADQAKGKSLLAEELFAISGITAIMIGKTFVTITKAEDGDWDEVHKKTSSTIENFLNAGKKVAEDDGSGSGLDGHKTNNSELEKKICEILDKEIRPSVAMDGGDITFDRYDDGVVYLYMQGACAGCPSSTMTLRMGIETRLKQAIPEIREVVSAQ